MLEWLWTHAIGWWGLTGIIVAAAVAVFIFLPGLKREAILVAAGAILASILYTRGSRDKQKEWDRANKRDVEKGHKARADAERAVDADPDGVQRDKWNRDNG